MSNSNAPWFRLRGDRWKADTRGLNSAEKGIYIDLLVEMHDREEPLSDVWLEQVRSLTRVRAKTFYDAIDRIVVLGLFARIDGGLWCDFMAGEIEQRGKRSAHARQNSEKSRQKSVQSLEIQRKKTQENQTGASAIETETKTYKGAPTGAPKDTDTLGIKEADAGTEQASAYAGLPGLSDDFEPDHVPSEPDISSMPSRLSVIPAAVETDDLLDDDHDDLLEDLERRARYVA
ncbi:DUF1376 domain-containing protein [Aliihoeflea sp. 40Bstr573]|uniref:DUF1376 domain-containing protein n=1 Tax=Aliihoeflea sp. 40Bstr573 TaxID=2696467 RepID=UPI002095A2B7|nr:hypothetical protein [Aliihoeflea sp. 40Bstr573]